MLGERSGKFYSNDDERPRPLVIEHDVRAGRHVVRVSGEVDIFSVSEFTSALANAYAADEIIVDLRGCRYMDSSALSALTEVHRRNRRITLVVPSESAIRRVLEITKLDSLMPVTATLPGEASAGGSAG